MTTANLKIQKVVSTDTYAKYEILPFPRGYGHTFATPLRRILLSGIKGATITSIKVKGVPHEFSTLKGVKEDVLTLIGNLQSVVFKMNSSEKENIVLKLKGGRVVTAADIKVPSNIEIINDSQYICEMTTDDAEIELEAVVESGYGFEVANNEIRNELPGTIPVSKSFSPVEKVNVSVVATRVSQETDWENIVLEIWTKGIAPDEALKQAVDIFYSKLGEVREVILNFDSSLAADVKVQDNEEEK